ncbi:MAG: DUF1963 domain-containing protein [Neisseriaceae bacterium]|nr:DUF1963 domain-containing protein [Neisseriaceae bacterium]
MSNKRQEILDWLEKNRRPEIRIQFKKAEQPLSVGASKIGGCPDVPAGFVWPRVKGGGNFEPRDYEVSPELQNLGELFSSQFQAQTFEEFRAKELAIMLESRRIQDPNYQMPQGEALQRFEENCKQAWQGVQFAQQLQQLYDDVGEEDEQEEDDELEEENERENMLRPLAFMAQFNLSELSDLDKENLLPKSGHLLFFYDYESGDWGENQQCAKVFYFPHQTPLTQMPLPDDMDEYSRIPELKLSFQAGSNVQDQARTEEIFDNLHDELDYDDDIDRIWGEGREGCTTKLLGYADCVQNSMEEECALRANGLDWDDYSNKPEVKAQVDKEKDDWILLFQLDTIYWGDDFSEEDEQAALEQAATLQNKIVSGFENAMREFKENKDKSSILSSISNIFGGKNNDADEEDELDYYDDGEMNELMFGDGGTLYFWIRKQDLAAGRFDKVIFISQCH